MALLKTVNELAAEYGVHPTQISQWKGQLAQGAKGLFGERRAKEGQDHEALQASLYEQIGRLRMELDWLKKRVCPTYPGRMSRIPLNGLKNSWSSGRRVRP